MKEPTTQQKVRTWLDKHKNWEKESNAGFAFIYEEGEASRPKSGACHYEVLNHGIASDRTVKAIVSRIRRTLTYGGIQSPHSQEFYGWLFNRSPFSPVFMYKGAQGRWREGWCVVSTNHPANLIQAALITTRNTWEYAHCIDMWKFLKDKGVDESLAFVVATFVSKRGDECSFTSHSTHHHAINSSATVDGIRAFVSGKALNLKGLYVDGIDSGTGVHKLWEGKEGQFLARLKADAKAYFSEGSKKTNTNPFIKAKPKPTSRVSFTKESLAKFLIECKDQLLEKRDA